MAPKDKYLCPTFINPPSLADPEFYSHAVSVDGPARLVFTSGQVGGRKDGTFPDSFKEQVEQAFKNLEEVLHASGAQIRDVIKLKWFCVNWKADQSFQDLLKLTFAFLTDHNGGDWRVKESFHPSPNPAELRLPSLKADVVIVGAGFSGLQTAYDLHQAGHKVLVLEAKKRVGGRSWTIPLKSGKGRVELGATWINQKTQRKVYGLAKQFGLDTVEQYAEGLAVYQDTNGHVFRTDATSVPEDKTSPAIPGKNFNLQQMFQQVELLQKEVDLRKTSKFPVSIDVSVETWIKQNQFTPFAADYLRAFVRGIVCREPEDVGIHYALDYIKSGTSAIAEGLANALPPGFVMLNTPVDRIEQYGRSVTLGTTNGLTVETKKVVIAIPTHVYQKIHFSPPLPYEKRAIVSRTKPGHLAKVIVTYARPWWREIGLVGIFQSFTGPINLSWEVSDFANKQYSLALFLCGDAESKWEKLSSLHREEALINHLVELVGPEHGHLAKDVLEINEQIWTQEEYIEGAPTSAIGPGDLSRYGNALRAPFQNLFFGGGETAFEWKGYMEGALRAGSRVADEVNDALSAASNSKL
ncbi:hypothetical protein N7509_003827 [Penicillium cosmopolitanum]|uniref:Amine oxidase n=1 Tax=Penicillium cosmopolitanum TaxID=1131564 RepID=A0A9W9W626_9EURO|nr:uncharacterized protein N7509_003827 [Penicillium cosmopolitanum]KAJ5403956.1 hypothetical protein N7509_003827 [Penicillium cosmopolitanum]